MNKLKRIVVAVALVAGFGLVAVPASVGAVNAIEKACSDPTVSKDSLVCDKKDENIQGIIGAVVNTLLFLLGIAAVIVIIIGGITYTTSAGEAAAIAKAKNMILYAVIGLVVAFSAYAIVNWVLKAFG